MRQREEIQEVLHGDSLMRKVLGLTQNNARYRDVPEGLMWAIPIHECIIQSDIIAEGRERLARVRKQMHIEFKAERRSKFSLVPKPLGS